MLVVNYGWTVTRRCTDEANWLLALNDFYTHKLIYKPSRECLSVHCGKRNLDTVWSIICCWLLKFTSAVHHSSHRKFLQCSSKQCISVVQDSASSELGIGSTFLLSVLLRPSEKLAVQFSIIVLLRPSENLSLASLHNSKFILNVKARSCRLFLILL